MPEDMTVVVSGRCPNWEVPIDCAVKVAKSGDSALDVKANGMAYCVNCGLEFIVDGFVREHGSSTDSETGLRTMFGTVLKKTGKQRNRAESFDRLSHLCNTVLRMDQASSLQAASILQKLMDSGAAKGGRGFVVLEIVAAFTAARMNSQSIKLDDVLEAHRGWTTKEGEYKAIKSVTSKSVRRLMSELQRNKQLPVARPDAASLIGANKWCLENLSEDTLQAAMAIATKGTGTPDSIAAASILMASGDARVIRPGSRFHTPSTGRENDGQKMTIDVAIKIFPATSPRTVRKRLKELRESLGIAVKSNPVVDQRKSMIRLRLQELVAELGGELDEDKPPFGITAKDVEILKGIKRQ